MEQNLDDVCRIAQYAQQNRFEVFYQPIEQNYNTVEDHLWFESSETWPKNPERAVMVVKELLDLKMNGLPIANSIRQLNAMIPYFRDPAKLRVATQAHSAHERKTICSAITMLQIQANGDVTACSFKGPVGNIRTDSVRHIWESRPHWWEQGCCLDTSMSDKTKS